MILLYAVAKWLNKMGVENMEKTLTEKLLDLSTELQRKLNELSEERAEYLLEKNEDEYFICYDSDSVDVGVGMLTVRQEKILDEERAEEDAKEEIIIEVANLEDSFYTLLEDNKISSLLADVLSSL